MEFQERTDCDAFYEAEYVASCACHAIWLRNWILNKGKGKMGHDEVPPGPLQGRIGTSTRQVSKVDIQRTSKNGLAASARPNFKFSPKSICLRLSSKQLEPDCHTHWLHWTINTSYTYWLAHGLPTCHLKKSFLLTRLPGKTTSYPAPLIVRGERMGFQGLRSKVLDKMVRVQVHRLQEMAHCSYSYT